MASPALGTAPAPGATGIRATRRGGTRKGGGKVGPGWPGGTRWLPLCPGQWHQRGHSAVALGRVKPGQPLPRGAPGSPWALSRCPRHTSHLVPRPSAAEGAGMGMLLLPLRGQRCTCPGDSGPGGLCDASALHRHSFGLSPAFGFLCVLLLMNPGIAVPSHRLTEQVFINLICVWTWQHSAVQLQPGCRAHSSKNKVCWLWWGQSQCHTSQMRSCLQ